jgi:hypothetical protein
MDKKLTSLLAIFFLTFGIFFSVIVFNKPLSKFIRASQELVPSASNSLVLAWPLTVKADGVSQSIITVFLRNEKNAPVGNRPVTITSTLGKIKEDILTTEKDGKAEFHLTSTEPGIAELTINTNNIILSQKISVKFE